MVMGASGAKCVTQPAAGAPSAQAAASAAVPFDQGTAA